MTEEDGTENEDQTENAENGEVEADTNSEAQESEATESEAGETEDSADETTIGDVLDEEDNWSNLRDPSADDGKDLEAVYDIPVRVSTVLGKSSMQVNDILRLTRGAVVELDRKVGESVDIYVNDRLVARGEIVVVENRLGITMTEIVKTQKG